MHPHTEAEQLAAARSLARSAGLFIAARAGKHHVFRKAAARNIHCGFRSTASALFALVQRLARGQ